jgi:hypothetical protein
MLFGEINGKQGKLSPYLIKHHAMEVEVKPHAFLTLALDGGK